MGLLEQIFQAGVVGAGGAGFPTHKKLTDNIEILVANAAECEPLLASDRYVMREYPEEIIAALAAIKREFNIPRVVIGTKAKYTREIDALQRAIRAQRAEIEIHGVSSFYPAGDEQILLYEITGKTVPPGGIPLAVGAVVINITTALSVFRAMQGEPVTRKYITVTGEVGSPVIVDAPVGVSVADCIQAAGGHKVSPYAIIKGGPMMGQRFSMEHADTLTMGKQDGGIILLPEEHALIQFDKKPLEHMINQAKSVCIQCSYCTELCPRYLIGHKLRPHRVMRSVATGTGGTDLLDAMLCCECGVCELFACPMQLSPRKMNIYVKDLLRERGARVEDKTVYGEQTEPREFRRIAQGRIIDRLELSDYPTRVDKMVLCEPERVRIPLKHGVGKPSVPVVGPGDPVSVGDVIAAVDFADVGCMVHASIDGTVRAVEEDGILIERKGGVAQ